MSSSLATLALPAVALFAASLVVTDRTPAQVTEKPKTKPAEGSTKKAPEDKFLVALRKASTEELPAALVAYIQNQIDSSATYSGQYDALKTIDGAMPFIHEWIKIPPKQAKDRVGFRVTCIRAARDVHGDKAPEDLMKTLTEYASSKLQVEQIRNDAMYALAQFGDRSHVEGMIKTRTAQTQAKDPGRRANGYLALANIHYNIRDYEKAVTAWEGLIGILDTGSISARQPATFFYNAACSMALAGQKDKAFKSLSRALSTGSGMGRRLVEEDKDIASLRDDPRFAKLMDKHYGEKKPPKKPKEGGKR